VRLLAPVCTAAVVLTAAAPALAGVFRKAPYVQNVTRTTAVVVFELWAPAPAVVHLREAHGSASAPAAEWVVRAPAAPLQEVRVTGLQPSRRYGWTVEVGGARETGEIATAPLPHEAFSFIAWGDTRSGDDAHRALCERLALETPDLILHTGDFVSGGGDNVGWQTFFDIEHELMRRIPVYPAIGNHDREGLLRRTEHFRRYFALPDDSPNPERYYAFTWGNSRFITLDSTEPSFALAEQTLWLEEQLKAAVGDPEIRHVFVQMHHPLYSTSTHGAHEGARVAWAPLFERYRVDLVFAGHDHVYEHLARGGVRYITTGGGGAPLYFRRRQPPAEDAAASVLFENSHHYVRVHVAGDAVEVAAVRVDGEVIDSFAFGTRPAGVCRADRDCDGLTHPACPGAWRCLGQACDFRCNAAVPVRPAAAAPAPAEPAAFAASGADRRRALWLGVLALCCVGGALLLRRKRG
jgi:3',5'-cyclic AMP phosphodiesterase CpdA